MFRLANPAPRFTSRRHTSCGKESGDTLLEGVSKHTNRGLELSNGKYLSWQHKVPTRPGLYIRTDGAGDTALVLASIERFIDGSRHAKLTHVSADFVPGPVKPVHEVLHHLRGDREKTRANFLGPIKLQRVPSNRALSRSELIMPAEPGIYYLSRNLGHAWIHQLIAVSIHRYQVGEGTREELFATDLPSFESRKLEALSGMILTPVLPQYRKLNLQQLPK
jgi:hypothetical protein